MTAYYNEFDTKKAEKLRRLISIGAIAGGDVDERSIKDVKADDLKGYTQCHFFAGIGGWSYALRLARWPDERPVWTGSCPCQPFSTAGSKRGGADTRHLWPTWKSLIGECCPATIFGEQVRSAISFGWLDEALSDLEEQNYACGSAVLPALCGSKAHERMRIWFVAHAEGLNDYGRPREVPCENELEASERQKEWSSQFGCSSEVGFIKCPDGLMRQIEPSIPLLVDGLSGSMDYEKDFGDAIVPQVARGFIEAYMEGML